MATKDPFSSLIIHYEPVSLIEATISTHSHKEQMENPPANNMIPGKMKPRRKEKKHVDESSK
jgi:hypothetical protein